MNITATLNNLITDWSKSLKKYPLFFLSVVFICMYFSYVLDSNTGGELRIFASLIILSITWLATYIACNSILKSVNYKNVTFIIAPILSAVFYFIIPVEQNTMSDWKFGLSVFMIVFSLHIFIALIPFIKDYNEKRFLNYNIKLLENFSESALLNLIFFGILSLAVYGITELFEINIKYKIYGHLFIWIAGIFHTTNFMSNFPSLENEDLDNVKFTSRFFKALVLYILIPSTIIYAIIIYAYTFKLILEGDIKPWLTDMCMWYFILGILTYYFSKVFLFSQENKLVNLFAKYYPIFSCVILLVMFYSCYHKINMQGVNDTNYFLTHATVAAFIAIIPFVFNSNSDKRIFPTSVIFLSLFSIAPGPFNVWNATINNQLSRLENVLIKNEVLKDNKLKKFTNKNFIGYDTLSTALYYLDNKKGLEILKEWDKDNILKDKIYAYDIMNSLDIRPNYETTAFDPKTETKTEYFNHLPKITFKEGEILLPLLNKYSTPSENYEGIKLIEDGSFVIYSVNNIQDPLTIISTDLKLQKVILESKDKSIYTLYFQTLVYSGFDNDIKVEDVVGVVVR